jgi:hypothetical protein
MRNSHNGPKCVKNHENDNIEFIFLIAQLDKDQLIIQKHFYKFWYHSLQDLGKNKDDTFLLHFLFSIFFMKT